MSKKRVEGRISDRSVGRVDSIVRDRSKDRQENSDTKVTKNDLYLP